MKLGKISFIILLNFFINNLSAENKITTSPLVNLEKLKPSYEDVEKNEDYKEIKSLHLRNDLSILEEDKWINFWRSNQYYLN